MLNRFSVVRNLGATLLILLATTVKAWSVEVSGLADFVAKKNVDYDYTNETFKGFSNFHTTRVRVFLDEQLGDNSQFFTQILIDNYTVSLYGAYARFEKLAGPYLNAQVGFIPTPIGAYAARTYSNVNPLIGTPLLYNHHSSFKPMADESVGSIDNLIQSRDARSKRGLPVIYDACWNSGLELYGSIGRFGYSMGLLAGSVSKPLQEQAKNVPQATSRVSYAFNPGLVLGLSAYYGPYLVEYTLADSVGEEVDLNGYINDGLGYDLYAARGFLEIYSELFYARWEYPTLPRLSAMAGYVEAKYKFRPRWYIAGRFDIFEPDQVKLSDGSEERWDYQVRRYEIGLGFRASRQVLLKIVSELNRLPEAPELEYDLHAFQLSIDFR